MGKTVLVALALTSMAIGMVACADRATPLEVTTHPDGWVVPTSGNFHGKLVLESINKAESCATCHGADYRGGTAGVSCLASGCHAVYPHPADFVNSQASTFHGKYIAERALWDLSACRTCHGTDYSGKGVTAKNCLTCHTQAEGPEACNTCHGSDQNFAPPPDVLGATSTTVRSVGAHQTHVGASQITDALTPECVQCHVVPAALAAAGHVDAMPPQADVHFGLIATHDGLVTPSWDPAAATCSNVYCHGAFSFRRVDSANMFAYADSVITGNNPVMRWTEVGTGQAACGTCHGLPPTGHITATTCNGCHPRVVDADFNIIGKELHINGQIDVF